MIFHPWFYSGARRSNVSLRSMPELSGRLKYSTEMTDVEGKSVLIVGDSYGWYANYALKSKARLVHSLDIAPSSPVIRNLEKKNQNFRHFTVSILDFSSSYRYDVCVFFEVIEHLPPSTELMALKIIYKHLSRFGVLLLSTPFSSLLSYISDPVFLLGHRHYTFSKLNNLLTRAGFKRIKFIRGGYIYGAIDLLSLYITKWIFHRFYKSPLASQINSEYPHPNGTTVFAVCQK